MVKIEEMGGKFAHLNPNNIDGKNTMGHKQSESPYLKPVSKKSTGKKMQLKSPILNNSIEKPYKGGHNSSFVQENSNDLSENRQLSGRLRGSFSNASS
jgi:hypothetical protein